VWRCVACALPLATKGWLLQALIWSRSMGTEGLLFR